jgi:hypothetical protein
MGAILDGKCISDIGPPKIMVANRGLNWQTGFTEEVVFK